MKLALLRTSPQERVMPTEPFVSTGMLPPPERVQHLVEDAYHRYRSNSAGETSRVYPALARVDPELFGIALVGINGRAFACGDSDHEFPIMSVSKPFVFALVCAELGPQKVRELVGANATGRPFNSVAAIE